MDYSPEHKFSYILNPQSHSRGFFPSQCKVQEKSSVFAFLWKVSCCAKEGLNDLIQSLSCPTSQESQCHISKGLFSSGYQVARDSRTQLAISLLTFLICPSFPLLKFKELGMNIPLFLHWTGSFVFPECNGSPKSLVPGGCWQDRLCLWSPSRYWLFGWIQVISVGVPFLLLCSLGIPLAACSLLPRGGCFQGSGPFLWGWHMCSG